jgi:hypothetical protein
MYSTVQNNLQYDERSCSLVNCHSLVTTHVGHRSHKLREIICLRENRTLWTTMSLYMLRYRKVLNTGTRGSLAVSSHPLRSGYSLLVSVIGYHIVCNITLFVWRIGSWNIMQNTDFHYLFPSPHIIRIIIKKHDISEVCSRRWRSAKCLEVSVLILTERDLCKPDDRWEENIKV